MRVCDNCLATKHSQCTGDFGWEDLCTCPPCRESPFAIPPDGTPVTGSSLPPQPIPTMSEAYDLRIAWEPMWARKRLAGAWCMACLAVVWRIDVYARGEVIASEWHPFWWRALREKRKLRRFLQPRSTGQFSVRSES